MKKLTKIILILALMLGILLLSSCANSGLGKKISITKLKEDITNDSQVQSCFTSAYVNESQFAVETIEIVKAQENEKDITTYSNVVVENAYFSISLYIKTIHNYYDHGGWIMDELCIEELKEITPISGPEKDLVHKYLAEHYSLSGMTDSQTSNIILDKAEFITTESVLKDTTIAHVYATYQTDTISVNGYVVFTLTSDGWINEDTTEQRPNYHIVDYTADYSQALGSFSTESGPVVGRVDLNVISINGTTVTYDLNKFSMPGFSYSVRTGKNLTSEFNPLTGEFWIGDYVAVLGITPLYLSYNTNTDTWSVAFSNLSRN